MYKENSVLQDSSLFNVVWSFTIGTFLDFLSVFFLFFSHLSFLFLSSFLLSLSVFYSDNG